MVCANRVSSVAHWACIHLRATIVECWTIIENVHRSFNMDTNSQLVRTFLVPFNENYLDLTKLSNSGER